MNVQERLEDIATISGYSKDVVHAVLKASMTSLAKTLRLGKRATLPGICTLIPAFRGVVSIETGTHEVTRKVALKAQPTKSLMSKLEDLDFFEEGLDSEVYKIPNIAAHQIHELE